ncbi:SusC/RagA family TonB-linked outer membrane protein [uncultured Polaribacter sp.]|uniref:SusC/RagA family TonB-linked outer membrane protein n=1 Tax=uncultured Polaribacter sp. TaxID=174711 RepID=UPI002618E3EF|nr:SusC/RagA family TonB-linked outer membrane protein [uncultured Polaribacter sp.]
MKIKSTNACSLYRKRLLMMIMRTFIFLVCTALFSFTTENSFSQKKVHIDKDQLVTVDQVFKIIKQQAAYNFLYPKNLFKNKPKIQLKKGEILITKLLEQSLSGDKLSYRVTKENTIIIREKTSPVKFQQEIKITGKVTDALGNTMPDVSIIIEGTKKGTSTDFYGKYKITTTKPSVVLIFSYLGFTTQKKTVNTNSVLNIIMKEDVNSLDEIQVVSTGFQEISKERVTGSYVTISGDELARAGSNISLKNRLEDLVPGLYFESNFVDDQNANGDDSRSVVIRGVSTFGNNNPLIVVDGFPLDPGVVDPFTVLNPDDVKSVTVLKDAAAASIWGAQAANGVIVIVTKKGKKGAKETSYNFTLDYLIKPKPNLSKIPWAESGDAIEFYKNLILDNTYYDDLLTTDYGLYELPPAIKTLIDMKSGRITQVQGNSTLDMLSKRDVRNEFSDLFLRPESFQRMNVSITVPGEKNSFRTSLTTIVNEGYAKGDSNIEFLANINDEYIPNKWLKFGVGLNFYLTQEKNNGVDINELSLINQHERILDNNGGYNPMIKQDPRARDLYYDFGTEKRRDSVAKYNLPYNWDWNLKQDVTNRDNSFEKTNLRLNAHMAIKPIDPLQLEVRYQYVQDNSLTSNYFNEESWTTRNTINYSLRPDGTLALPTGGMLTEFKAASSSHNIRAQFVFNPKFGKHDFTLLGGTEWRKDESQSTPSGYYGYDPQSLTTFPGIDFSEAFDKIDGGRAAGVPVLPGTTFFGGVSGQDNRYVSYYGNIGYNFDRKYDITGSIRLDKTNLYGQSDSFRDLPQWSVGAGWNITQESFFNVNFIDRLRVRASYGFNGNIDKSASPFIQGSPWTDPVTRLPYTAVQFSPNPNLTWERTEVFNVGLDFRLFQNKLYGTLEYYKKLSSDVLVSTEVNGTYGFQNNRATLNAGNIENSGVELSLSSNIINKKDYSLRSQFLISTNDNKTTGYQAVGFSIASYLQLPYFFHLPNLPVDYIYAMRFAGYDDEGLPQYFYGKDAKIVSAAEGVRIPVQDLDSVASFVGRRNPKIFGSFQNTFRYKSFELNVRLSYKFGHKFFSDYPRSNIARDYFRSNNQFTWLSELITDRWQSPEDGDDVSMHSLNEPVTDFNALTNIRYLEQYGDHKIMDAGQVRLQAISLAYNFQRTPLFKWIKSASVRIEGRNLGAIWVANNKGIDPSNVPYSASQYGALRYVTRFRPEYSLGLRLGL